LIKDILSFFLGNFKKKNPLICYNAINTQDSNDSFSEENMPKQLWKPGTMVYPAPAVMVSCGSMKNPNIITVSWTGTVCTDPAMTYVSLRKTRYSHALISESGTFVINLTTKSLARATDFCGVKSGRDIDKFSEMQLHAVPGPMTGVPMIEESPLSIECEVTQVMPLGSHDMFLAKVLGISIDERYLEPSGKFRLDLAEPICYSHGTYFELGEAIGGFGFSVKKATKKKRRKR
jgi:flavin reductase (DIM6/NTAB) family NADH-FMN oxidoreductase RutF